MPASQVCRFAVDPASSTLGFDAKSTLHPVHGAAKELSGSVTAAIDDGKLALDPMPTMKVQFPVERLSSGNALQDQQMWKLLDSKRNPVIAATLKSLEPGNGNAYKAVGEITLNGRGRRYDGNLTIAVDGDRLVVDGSIVVDIRDFGLQPPRLLMITVQPEVTVTLHLVAAASSGGS